MSIAGRLRPIYLSSLLALAACQGAPEDEAVEVTVPDPGKADSAANMTLVPRVVETVKVSGRGAGLSLRGSTIVVSTEDDRMVLDGTRFEYPMLPMDEARNFRAGIRTTDTGFFSPTVNFLVYIRTSPAQPWVMLGNRYCSSIDLKGDQLTLRYVDPNLVTTHTVARDIQFSLYALPTDNYWLWFDTGAPGYGYEFFSSCSDGLC